MDRLGSLRQSEAVTTGKRLGETDSFFNGTGGGAVERRAGRDQELKGSGVARGGARTTAAAVDKGYEVCDP